MSAYVTCSKCGKVFEVTDLFAYCSIVEGWPFVCDDCVYDVVDEQRGFGRLKVRKQS
jgi:hypothetical protein